MSDDEPGMSVRIEEAGGETWRERLASVAPLVVVVFEVRVLCEMLLIEYRGRGGVRS